MRAAENLYYIDGNDVFLTYGFVAAPGNKEQFMKPRKRKTPQIVKDWPEQNLTEYDLSNPRFEARKFKFAGTLLANSVSDFNTKFADLVAVMEKAGTRIMGVTALGQQFGFFCSEWTQLKPITKITGTKIAVQLEFELTEVAFVGGASSTHTFPYTFPITF